MAMLSNRGLLFSSLVDKGAASWQILRDLAEEIAEERKVRDTLLAPSRPDKWEIRDK